ncbi:SDR family NAD(P)-dependent oxidoreductase [Nocardia sp. bgisy118]|uniref:SDR family NAD(P)-dependent oxidoreductase n=1 Tax=Nocardia sp. bgisy118 TaxID=3413786 RepID=UPI003F49E6C6
MSTRKATGRVAVVTGGAAGIGQAFAERLAVDGHVVAVADVGPADETLRLIEKAGGRGFAAHCDVSSPESVRAFAAEVEGEGELGQVDVLVNNAGTGQTLIVDGRMDAGMNESEGLHRGLRDG